MYKLFCFPFAGSSATSYVKWTTYFNDEIEVIPVELAGHGKRLYENFYTNFNEMVDDCFEIVMEHLQPETKFAFWGHSMGGYLAFSIASQMAKRKLNYPQQLFLSGCMPPSKTTYKDFHTLNDERLIEEISKLGATDKKIFSDPNVKNLFLPIIRADFFLLTTFEYTKNIKIGSNLKIINGKEDPNINFHYLNEWEEYTIKECEYAFFTGDHFYFFHHMDEIVKIIKDSLFSV